MVDAYFWKLTVARGRLWAEERVSYWHVGTLHVGDSDIILLYRASIAQSVEHRVVMREVVSSTPAGPSLRVLK